MIRTSPWLAATLALVALASTSIAPDARASGGGITQFEGMPIAQSDAGDAGGAAGRLRATADCSSTEMRKAAVTLEWTVAQPKGTQQRVLVSVYGFREGRFEASEPLAPDQSTLAWSRVHGQAIHSWMVLTLQGGSWRASTIDTFTGPSCVADMHPAPQR
jgi:hypothetical protein